MAIIMQSVFSPRKGFDFKNDIINGFIASKSLDYGTVVNVSNSTLCLANTSSWGYFLMEQVTTSGPTMAEFMAGDIQYEKKAGADTGVAVLIPRNHAVVRTARLSSNEVAPAAGVALSLSAGVFITASVSTTPMGRIKEVITDSISTTLYDVEIMNA